ncbi:hypothetical protein KC19_8G176200 [Ceratodon purpureus]|uniref:TORTIFOLIA1/SINE1-2 N-terminal domain-containing protein n=1 Tax=Ceratodon purpureus TaxID=3225 RepID=A0A8T0H4J1_CERPU|nr:hypothetical protein KC19_8G176200 [Ceratodon purpureus]
MREEESSRYLSPLVKQDLAKLDTDGDTRRIAIKSLKLFVEQLDSSTLPRFISQIAESRESGGTRSYAISLYEEVARVHGKLVIPHISKVVGSLVRSSSASGSFPQLQLACARVTAALARYGIDSGTSQEDAEKIMQEICAPLTDALAGKLEPVAANAAACIHALVETEQWKYTHEEVVHEVCQRTTVALSEKPTRTAAHMQLACILASANPDTLSIYGASLLRAGEDTLKVPANSWQLRKAAAKLLQSVLTILDKETLETELQSALHALDTCRLDKMPHVRAAVSEALHTAKMLASGNTVHKSLGTAASPVRKSPDRNDRSLWSEIPVSPISKRDSSPRAPMSPIGAGTISPRAPMSPIRAGTISPRAASPSLRTASPTSQGSRRHSYSSASTSASDSVPIPSSRSNGRSKAKRAPIYPPRGSTYAHSPRSAGTPGTSPSSSTTTVEECESPSRRLVIAKENVRSRGTKVNGFHSEEYQAGHGEKYLRPRTSVTSSAFTPLLPNQLGVGVQKLKRVQDSKNVGTDVPFPDQRLSDRLDDIAKHNEDFEQAQLLGGFENARQARLSLPRLKLGAINSQTGMMNNDANFEVEKREVFTSGTPIRQNSAPAGAEMKSGQSRGHGQPTLPTQRHNTLAHLGVNLEDEKTKSLAASKDFLPFVPPTRLVRSLSSLSNPESLKGSLFEQDMKLSQDDLLRSMNADGAEMDLETSSEAGWSVRDNPIASEESYRSDSSDEEMNHRRYGDDFPRLRKVGSLDSSPREIHMIIPEPKTSRSFNDGATLDPSGRARNPEAADDVAEHLCSCVSGDRTFSISRTKSGGGLSNLLHKDEIKRDGVCSACACKLCVNDSSEHCRDTLGESKPDSPAPKEIRGFQPIRMVWRRLRWCTEAALGGSLFLVLALPLAMVLGKALNGSREYEGLLPT